MPCDGQDSNPKLYLSCSAQQLKSLHSLSYQVPSSLSLSMHSSEVGQGFENLCVDIRASYFVVLSFPVFAFSISSHSGSLNSILRHFQSRLAICFSSSYLILMDWGAGNKHLTQCRFLLSRVESPLVSSSLITLQSLQIFFFLILSKVGNCLWEG